MTGTYELFLYHDRDGKAWARVDGEYFGPHTNMVELLMTLAFSLCDPESLERLHSSLVAGSAVMKGIEA